MEATAGKIEKKSRRDSNLELLRILTMLVIVAHHYVTNSGLMPLIDAKEQLALRDYFLLLFSWGGKTGINCFVMITGYFMCASRITREKLLKLVGELYFYNIVIWFVFFLAGYEQCSLRTVLGLLMPVWDVSTGFVDCFLLFYLLIPFLNKLIHALSEREHFLLMAWGLGVYTALPSFLNMKVTFNYVTWFCILYIVASYLRLYPKPWTENVKITGLLAAGSLLLSWASVLVLAWLCERYGMELSRCCFFVADSNKILAVTTGVFVFLFFKNWKIGYSRWINAVAGSTFGVLLIHANSGTMSYWLWQEVCGNAVWYESGNVVVHAVVCVAAIYAVCTAIDMLRIRLWKGVGLLLHK